MERGVERVPVETVRPGDEVQVGRHQGLRVVSGVERYEDGSIVVTYFRHGEYAFEYSARRRGPSFSAHLVEIGLAAKRPGDLLEVVRGRPERAEQLRRQMEVEQAARWERLEERLREERERERAA
jgi:hypothetical protein